MALPARQDWRVRVLLDGVDISDRVVSEVEVTAEEDSAMVAGLTVYDAGADVLPENYAYQPLVVEHDEMSEAGVLVTTTRVFDGRVQSVETDLDARTLSLSASDGLQTAVEALSTAAIDALVPGSLWDSLLTPMQDNPWTYMQQRLASLPASLHRSVAGTLTVTPWDTTAAPAWSLDGLDIVEGSLRVSVTERRDRPDGIRLHLQLRHARRWRRNETLGWTYPRSLTEYAQDSTELPSRDMIERALEGVSGWEPDGVGFTPVWADQTVTVGGSQIVFTHDQDQYVIGASAQLTRTWTQSVSDTVTVTLQAFDPAAPPAAPQYEDRTVGLSSDADLDDDSAPASPATSFGNWLYENDGRIDLSVAATVAMRQAERDLQSDYRESSVTAEVVAILPGLTLADRIAIGASNVLAATGKVRQYTHIWTKTQATTTVRLALMQGRHGGMSLSQYAGGSDPGELTPPTPGAFSVPGRSTQLRETGDATLYDEDAMGFSGNFVPEPAVPYPYRFSLEMPDVPGELRDEHESDRQVTLEVTITTDALTLWPA